MIDSHLYPEDWTDFFCVIRDRNYYNAYIT